MNVREFLKDYRDCVTGWIASLGNFLVAIMVRDGRIGLSVFTLFKDFLLYEGESCRLG